MADVTAEAIQAIVELAAPTVLDGAPGFKLSEQKLNAHDVRPALPEFLQVETLSGLVDLIEQKAYGAMLEDLIVAVRGPELVCLQTRRPDEFGRRPVAAVAKLPAFDAYGFGQFSPHEDFVMKIMTLFASYDDDREYVLQMARNVTAGSTVKTSDDGITQNVIIQTGAALKSAVALKSRVKLAPFRTFRECTQPISEFCFRLKMQSGIPCLALLESDGGTWRIEAMKNIKTWLTNSMKAQGVGNVPVIA